ncbi:MAG: response regulator, partial [Sandaracinus sp.]
MSGGWVLIVEDDSGLARTILQVLRLEGVADAQHAVNVPAALALASRPGLVGALVDVWLPGGHGNGVALATKLRDLHPAADIVVWSGADDMALVREAHQARFDFLTKDAGAELLRERVQRWAAEHARASAPARAEDRVREIGKESELTDVQARALALAFEQRTYSEIATALGV